MMRLILKFRFVSVLVVFAVFSCQSVKQYNAHIDSEISVKKQRKDLDFIHKKLIKNHPKLDLYLSENEISFKFDSLKKTIDKPLTPNEFFLKINPIISQLRHGHTDIFPLYRKSTKSEIKRLKNSVGPFSQITTFWQNDSLYLIQVSKKDSILKIGSKILSIDGVNPQQLKAKYQSAVYGDGFNETYLANRLNRSFFTNYYLLEKGLKDSINLRLSYKGKQVDIIVKRVFNKEDKKKEKASKKDTIKQESTDKVKTEKLKSFNFSFNQSTKSYARILSFPTNDSTFAVLKVNTFSFGNYKKDYQSIFKIIHDYKVKNLVLDLRNNGGGRLADANQLFAYLKPDEKEFIADQLVNNAGSFQRAIVGVVPKILKPIIYPLSYISYFITSKKKDNYSQIKPSLSRIKTKYLKDDYSGNLYVIINGGSYSASVMISANLKGVNRAYFVGEETGGDANGTVAGLMPDYKLPHSKLKLSIGTIYLTPKYFQTEQIGHGIYPDQEIKTTLKDRLNQIDPQLRWILKDVKNDNSALKKVVK